MKKCGACEGTFKWNDDVAVVDDEVYHEKCLDLVPQDYYAFLEDDPLGEVEHQGMVFEVLEEGEYEDD